MNTLDINSIREQFPILSRKIYDKYPLVYLDNAATTQKPRLVVEAMSEEYYNVNANVHRGVHFLSQQATDLHEAARERVRTFLNARNCLHTGHHREHQSRCHIALTHERHRR